MMSPRVRMGPRVRAELEDAVRSGAILHATRFAADFAERHDLNPETVRTTISRMRADLGTVRQPRAFPPRLHRVQIVLSGDLDGVRDLRDALTRILAEAA